MSLPLLILVGTAIFFALYALGAPVWFIFAVCLVVGLLSGGQS